LRLPSNKNIDYFSTYTYDANGNRASATVNGQTTTASYTLDDQLEVYGDNTYYYDEDGYLSEKTAPEGTTTYTYGTLGQLLSVETPTLSVEYLHNANNQRVAKKVNGVITEKYLWADLTTLLAVYDGSDNLVQRFEYAGSRMPVAMTYNGQKYYLHYDQVGSLRAVSDASRNMVKEVTYDTFGNILSDSDPAFKVPFGFTGGLYDADTGLTRFGYRDYDAYTGKWTAKDPIGFEGGDANLYGYVLGDPVNFVDPNGLEVIPDGRVVEVMEIIKDEFPLIYKALNDSKVIYRFHDYKGRENTNSDTTVKYDYKYCTEVNIYINFDDYWNTIIDQGGNEHAVTPIRRVFHEMAHQYLGLDSRTGEGQVINYVNQRMHIFRDVTRGTNGVINR